MVFKVNNLQKLNKSRTNLCMFFVLYVFHIPYSLFADVWILKENVCMVELKEINLFGLRDWIYFQIINLGHEFK